MGNTRRQKIVELHGSLSNTDKDQASESTDYCRNRSKHQCKASSRDYSLRIDQKIRSILPPRSEQELRNLKDGILLNRSAICRIYVWTENNAIVDGHCCYEICKKHNLPFEIVRLNFRSRDEAIYWRAANQLNRRNLNAFQRCEVVLALEPIIAAMAKERQIEGGRTKVVQNSAQDPDERKTRSELANLAGVSHDTITKAKMIIAEADEETKASLRREEISINQAYHDVRKMLVLRAGEQREREALKRFPSKPTWIITPDQRVVPCDLLLTDPPYGVLKEEWEPKDSLAFTREWSRRWAGCGADFIATFFSSYQMGNFREFFDFPGYEYQETAHWIYDNNLKMQTKSRFQPGYEPIHIFKKHGSKKTLNYDECSKWREGYTPQNWHLAKIPQSNFKGVDRKTHPAQKPLSVMKWLVHNLSRTGELVCDCFCGSGTTGIAAVSLGRRFHGIEINKEFRSLGNRRIAAYGNAQSNCGPRAA